MFEAHVLYMLRKYLGDYVHGLSSDALKISVWQGDVVLKDLQLKQEALNALKLPIKVKAGFLGSVTLKVPWKSLGKEPVIIYLDRVFLLAEPSENELSSMEEDKEGLFEAKRRKIEEAELATLEARDKKTAKPENSPETNTWFGSLIATVVGNVKVSITNVHIRYEDSLSNPGRSFCSGITLAKLAAVTTDENGVETFDTSGAIDRLCKTLQLERFAVYHDSYSKPWTPEKSWQELNAKEWSEIFEAGIQDLNNDNGKPSTKWGVGRQYLLHPVNGVLKYQRDGRQEKPDPSIPSQKISLTVNDVSLTITESQYSDGMKLVEGVSRYRVRLDVSHFRPAVSIHQNAGTWWRYAYQASLHREGKTGQQMSWKNISRICHLRRKYVEIYSEILQQGTPHENVEMREIEKELDSKVILLWRLLAHARVESVKSKELALQRERARKSSWWSFGWGSASKGPDVSVAADVMEVSADTARPGQLTKDEWKKLSELLGYDPSDDFSLLPGNESPNMLQISVDAKIGICAAHLINENNVEIIGGKFESLEVGLKLYPKSMLCNAKLMSYSLSAPEGYLVQSFTSENKESALAATFIYLPIGENLDWKLSAKVASCHIMVSMVPIDRCLQFLRRNNSLSPEMAYQTATALQMKLEKVTRRAQEQIQLVLEEQSRFSLDIDLDAPKLQIPFEITECQENCSQLVVDFGHFTLRTINENEAGKANLYRRFYISGRDTAAFFMDGSFNWEDITQIHLCSTDNRQSADKITKSNSMHNLIQILDKCGMFAVIEQIKVPHPHYPWLRVAIEVPNLGFHFSPIRYSRLLNLLLLFGENKSGDESLGGTKYSLGINPWHATEVEGSSRVLFWGGIGNSVPEWKSCWMILSGSTLYIFESKTASTYQRYCSMSGKKVIEIPSASVGGSEFSVAISNRGFDFQKALESSSTVVMQFKEEEEKTRWMKALVNATYKASAPPSIYIPGDSGSESDGDSSPILEKSQKAELSVLGSLVEMKLFIYGKEEDQNLSYETEKMLLELSACGGKVHVTEQEGDLTVKMKLHTLMIEDKLQGYVSPTCRYIACSVMDNHGRYTFEEMGDACSPCGVVNPWEDDDQFKDALSEFSFTSESLSKFPSRANSMSSTPKETMHKLSMVLKQEDIEGDNLSDFVCVTLTTRQPDSFSYDGVDTQMCIRMTKLDFFCNRSTVVALIDLGMDLSQLMDKAYATSVVDREIEEDTSGMKESNCANERAVVKGLLGNGKSRAVFQLKMNVNSVSIYLNKEDGSQLAMLIQENFQMDLKVHPSSLSIEGLLGNLRICDMSNGPCHRWGRLCDMRDTACDSLVKWNFQSFSSVDDDFEGYDYSLTARLSAVRIIFLYRFVTEVMEYFYGLATPQAQQVIQVVDIVGGMELFIQQSDIEGSSALKLDISLDNPIIVMPENSTSKNYIQLDLGHLNVTNSFKWYGCKETDASAVHLDVINVEMKDINMSVGIDGMLGKPMIDEAHGLQLTVSRILRDVFKKVPEMSIDIKIELLHGAMSDKEYKVIIDCIFSNISEEASPIPSVRASPEKLLNIENSRSKTHIATRSNDDPSSVLPSSYIQAVWTIEVYSASLDLSNGMDRESPLARMELQGLWVAYRTSSTSDVDLYVTLSKISILDLRPTTRPEMRLMLGSATDVEGDELKERVSLTSEIPKLTMLVVDWRVKQDSQAFVVRMQQPRLLVVLDFLLAVGEYFVPSLGSLTGREETTNIENDPIGKHTHIRLTTSVYRQKEDNIYLSAHQKLIADACDIGEFTYDGCGNTICLIENHNIKRSPTVKPEPVIIIGYGKKLRFKNVKIKSASKLKDYISLKSNSSFSATPEDGVIFDFSNTDDLGTSSLLLESKDTSKESSALVPEKYESNFIVEIQAVAPELTFYDSTKWSTDSNWKGERLLRAKLDINLMYAAKENDKWIRALVKGLTVDSSTGLAVLEPVDISGEYSCVQDRTKIKVVTTDIYVHLSLSALRLMLRLQDETASALQLGNTNALSLCNHFEKVWSVKQGDGCSQEITIWRPRPPPNYVILGDCITSGSSPPSQPVMAVNKIYGRVRKPRSFQLIWSFSKLDQGFDNDGEGYSVWMPIAPEGYVALGCMGGVGKNPPTTSVHCVRSDLLTCTALSDCIYYFPPNERHRDGFSIWRVDNLFGSFLAQATVERPCISVVLDLCEMLQEKINSGTYLEPTGTEKEMMHDGGIRTVDSRSGLPQFDDSSSTPKKGRYYASTPQFELIWWDKGNESRKAVSIWRPVPPPGYAIVGDSIVEGLDPPSVGLVLRDDGTGRVAKPTGFKKVHLSCRGLDDAFFWYPVPTPGFVSLGCMTTKYDTQPRLESICCVRMDLVNQVDISTKAFWPMTYGKGTYNCSLWRVENQMKTFIARSDLKGPPGRMAYGLVETERIKAHSSLSGELKIGCLSITLLEDLSGMVTPLVDMTLTNINLVPSGRFEALNVVVVSSVAASTFNTQLEVWEPLIEPFDGIFKYEAYDVNSDSTFRVGRRLRITATNVVNANLTSANAETLIGLTLAWKKHVEHEEQAMSAVRFEKEKDEISGENTSALEEDNSQKVIVENKLGCELYFKQFTDSFDAIKLLKPNESSVVQLPPLKYPDRINSVTESKALQHYIAVHITEAKELLLNISANENNLFCALRLVTTNTATDGPKQFPQSARSRCMRPLMVNRENGCVGCVNWNEVFIFEVPSQGETHLDVVITNLATKAGKEEAVGFVSLPIQKEANRWLFQTCLPQAMQQASSKSRQTLSLQQYKRQGRNDMKDDNKEIGMISLTTLYLLSKGNKVSENEVVDKSIKEEVGFKVSVSPGGPWASIQSILPIATLPQELGQLFGLEIKEKNRQKHATLRSLVTVVNNTDKLIQICLCPLALLRSSDFEASFEMEKSIVTEEVFENQCYNPLSGWGNKFPPFITPSNPGRWSNNDFSLSSKDFFEPRLPSGWRWSSEWFVDKSPFVDREGWGYASDLQSLKWPLSSEKSCKRSPRDFFRRRRWVRTRQRVSGNDEKNKREVVGVLKPGCCTSLPWIESTKRSDLCLQLRPLQPSKEPEYLWGIAQRYLSGSSGAGQNTLERSQSSRSFSRQSRNKTSASLFLLNQLEKVDETIMCCPQNGDSERIWFCINVDANILYRQLNSPVNDWKILVNVPLKLENKLPCSAKYIILEKTSNGSKVRKAHGEVISGGSTCIYTVDINRPTFLSWIVQGGWVQEKELFPLWDPSTDDLPSFLWMRLQNNQRKLRISVERDFGESEVATKTFRFSVPYWIGNDAALPLSYRLVEIEPSQNPETDSFLLTRAIKASKQAPNQSSNRLQMKRTQLHKVVNTLEILEDLGGIPLMLSPQPQFYRAGFQAFSSREDGTLLSPRLGISVTVSGNNNYINGISLCDLDRKERIDVKAFNSKGEYYKLSSFIEMSSERTKVIHFQPHTLFVNRVGKQLWLRQAGVSRDEVINPTDSPKTLLWNSSLGNELLKVSFDRRNWSCPFSVNCEGISHVTLNSELNGTPSCLKVEILNGTKHSRFIVTFQLVSVSSPYRIENFCLFLPIYIRQVGGESNSWHSIKPCSASSFAWEDLQREHLLEVTSNKIDPRNSIKYNIDEVADYKPVSTGNGPVQALHLSVCKEGITNVVRISEWYPDSDECEILPSGMIISSSSQENSFTTLDFDNQFHILVELTEFGLSVVDHTPEELLYLSIQNLIISYGTGLGSGTSRFKLRLDGLQIDNQIPLAPMAVLLRPHGLSNQHEFLLKLTAVMQNRGSIDCYTYSYLGIQGPSSGNTTFMIKVHEPIIWRLHEMVQKLNLARLNSNHATEVAVDPIIRIGLLNISEIRFKLSLAMSPTQRPRGVLGFWSSLMSALSNTENMPIRITPRIHENICMRQSEMSAAALANIRKDLLSQPLQLLYGVDILGNASSALGHISKGVAALSMDKKFIQSRQKQEQKGSVEDIGDVIREGGGAFAKGLFRGVTGIVTKPFEGARSSGVEGFVQGVGKGIIGVAAQPMSGVLDLLSKTTEGANAMRMKLTAAITSEQQSLRHRLPRAIGRDNVLQPFDEYRAQGQALLQLAECSTSLGQIDLFKVRGKFAFSDAYEDHFNLPKGRVAIITDHRVILLQKKNDPSKEPCTVIWDVAWDDLLKIEPKHGKRDPIGSMPSQLVLTLRLGHQDSRKNDSKDANRVIKCHRDSRQAEEVLSAILQAKNAYGPGRSIVAFQGQDKRKVKRPYAGVGAGAASGAALGMFTGFTAPIAIPVMATFGALLGSATAQVIPEKDSIAMSPDNTGSDQQKNSDYSLALTNTYSLKSGKFIDQMTPIWSDQKNAWNKNYRISIWRPNCPKGYISVGDVVQSSYKPPSNIMVYANKGNGKFIHPVGFDLVWRSGDGGSRDPLTIWMPRPPPEYVSIGCVAVPDFYEPDPSSVYCVRKDSVKSAEFTSYALQRDRRDGDLWECSIWQVQNEAHTFIVCRGRELPSKGLAFTVLP